MAIRIADTLTLDEALFLLGHHEEGGYFDACGQVVLHERGDNREGIQ